jgi:hypothetical protein
MHRILFLNACFFLILAANGQQLETPQSRDLAGTVISEAGMPLPRVKVTSCNLGETDDKGRYVVNIPSNNRNNHNHCNVIRFYFEGYQPLTKVIDSETVQLNVTLHSEKTEWKLAKCSSISKSSKRIDVGNMMITIPKGARTEYEPGGDTFTHRIFYGFDQQHGTMRITSGPLLGALYPSKDQLLKSSEIKERRTSCGSRPVWDYQGRDKAGLRWRYLPFFSELIEYRESTDEAANYFDSILESLCCK